MKDRYCLALDVATGQRCTRIRRGLGLCKYHQEQEHVTWWRGEE